MPKPVFSLAGQPALATTARALFDTPTSAPMADRRARITDAAVEYVQTVVDGMLLAFLSPNEAGTRTESLVQNLAAVVKRVSLGLVRSATSSAKPEEITKVTGYVQGQIVLRGATASIDFTLADDTSAGFLRVIEAQRAGRVDEERATLTQTMLAFVDEAIAHYLEGPFSQLELGFMTRKAFDVGRASIRTAARAAISHALAPDGDADLTHLVGYFDRAIVREAPQA